MGKKRVSDAEFERQYTSAVERGKRRAAGPRAASVSYDEGDDEIILEFSTGGSLGIPRVLLDELEGARPEDLARVELSPRGTALHWEGLDVDVSVAGALARVVGERAWLAAMGSVGGRATSAVKAEAARLNGLKGGRPPSGGSVRAPARTSAGRRAGVQGPPRAGTVKSVASKSNSKR